LPGGVALVGGHDLRLLALHELLDGADFGEQKTGDIHPRLESIDVALFEIGLVPGRFKIFESVFIVALAYFFHRLLDFRRSQFFNCHDYI
jgi:hypothetical protein